MLGNTTMWKVVVGNTSGKSLEKPKDDHNPDKKQAHATQTGGPDG